MRRLGRLLVVLLIAALPLQGAAAASRWLCVAGMHPDSAVAIAQSVADHRHDGDAHDGHRHDEAQPRPAAIDAHEIVAEVAHDGASTCSLCAACCLTVAAPPALPAMNSAPPAAADFPPVAAAIQDFLASGLERPPRR